MWGFWGCWERVFRLPPHSNSGWIAWGLAEVAAGPSLQAVRRESEHPLRDASDCRAARTLIGERFVAYGWLAITAEGDAGGGGWALALGALLG